MKEITVKIPKQIRLHVNLMCFYSYIRLKILKCFCMYLYAKEITITFKELKGLIDMVSDLKASASAVTELL